MGVHVGAIGAFTGTGTHTVTGLPFAPTAVVFWNVFQMLAPPGIMLGCATASGEQWVMWAGIDVEISGYTRKYNEGRTDCCIYNLGAPFTTVAYQAELTALTSDGFTVNVTTFNTTGEDIHYMALGGNNIGECHAGTFSAGSSTGTTSVTAPGFEPSALLVAHSMSTWAAGQQTPFRWGVGMSDGTNQFASFAGAEPASTHSEMYRTDSVACGISSAGTFRVELDSFDSGGFTVDVTDASSGNHDFGYLAIDAAAAAVGNGVMPDSTGTADLSTPGFEAQGVFFTWDGANSPTTAGQRVNPLAVRPGVGATTQSQKAAISAIGRDDHPFGVYTVDGYTDNAAISVRGQGSGIGGSDNDVLHSALFDASAQDTFTIEWDIATSGADRTYGWLALPGDLPFSWVPNIYRHHYIGGYSTAIAEFLLLEDGSRLILEDDSGFLLL